MYVYSGPTPDRLPATKVVGALESLDCGAGMLEDHQLIALLNLSVLGFSFVVVVVVP